PEVTRPQSQDVSFELVKGCVDRSGLRSYFRNRRTAAAPSSPKPTSADVVGSGTPPPDVLITTLSKPQLSGAVKCIEVESVNRSVLEVPVAVKTSALPANQTPSLEKKVFVVD